MAVVTTIGHVPRVTNITLRTKPVRTVAGTVSIAEKLMTKSRVAPIIGTVPVIKRTIRPRRNRTANTAGTVRNVTIDMSRLTQSAPAIGGTAGKRGVEKHMTWRNGSVVSIGGTANPTHGGMP